MGNLAKELCCAREREIDDFYPISQKELITKRRLNKFPSEEINLYPPSSPYTIKKMDSLSQIPISVSNIITQRPVKLLKAYEILEKIGEGSFGEVYKVRNRGTNAIRAMKKIHLSENYQEQIGEEINVMKNLNHINIIRFYEFFEEDNNIYLINEYLPYGDLQDKVAKLRPFPEFAVKIIMFQIFKALMYLNTQKIIHGDLKLENILINSYLDEEKEINQTINDKKEDIFLKVLKEDTELVEKEGKNEDIKKLYQKLKINNFEFILIDFGSSKTFYKYKSDFQDTIGTTVYSSPEVIKENYNIMCDIWSCGIIMHKLITGRFPFWNCRERELRQEIINKRFKIDEELFKDKNISLEARDLIEKCLEYDTDKRILIEGALRHPFFNDLIESLKKDYTDEEKEILKELKNHSKKTKFYQLVLSYLAYNFENKKNIKRLSEMFYKIDYDFDSKINSEKLLQAYKKANIDIDPEDPDKIIESFDFYEDGYIDYQEFIRACLPKEELFTEKNLKMTFDIFDIDQNEIVSSSDIEKLLGLTDKNGKVINEKLKKKLLDEIEPIMDFEDFKKNIMKEFS